MMKTPAKGNKTPAKNKSPTKAAVTPAKTPGKPAKTPVKPAGTPQIKLAQSSPKKATPMSSRKRAFDKQQAFKSQADEAEKEEQEDEEEVAVSKKAKQSPKGRRSAPPAVEESEDDSDAEEQEEESGDEEVDVNLSINPEDDDGEDAESDDDDEEAESDDNYDEDVESDDDNKEAESDDVKDVKSKRITNKELRQNKMQEIPKVIVKNLRKSASVPMIMTHFRDCGDILFCNFQIDKKTKELCCAITFKTLAEAKCAAGSMNLTNFMGKKITVRIVKVAHIFSPETAITISNVPDGKIKKLYRDIKRELITRFGPVSCMKFLTNLSTANVQFDDASSLEKAIEAKSFPYLDKDIKICKYVELIPTYPVLVFGTTPEMSEEDISTAMSAHCEVQSVTFAKNIKVNERKRYAFVQLLTEADVDRMIEMDTITCKGVKLDILPSMRSKHFFNVETKLYHRHPAGIFVENLPKSSSMNHLKIELGRFGVIDKVQAINNRSGAIIIYEDAASAKAAVKSNLREFKGRSITIKRMDGVYSPSTGFQFNSETTVHISGIPDIEDVKFITQKVIAICNNFIRAVPVTDALTGKFKHAALFNLRSVQLAQDLLASKLRLRKATSYLKVVMYDPDIHDYTTDDNVLLVEDLHKDTMEATLWRAFEKFGELEKAVIYRDFQNNSCGWGYIEFKEVDSAKNALADDGIVVNDTQVKVTKPTRPVINQLRMKQRLQSIANKKTHFPKTHRIPFPKSTYKNSFQNIATPPFKRTHSFKSTFNTFKGGFKNTTGGFKNTTGGFKNTTGGFRNTTGGFRNPSSGFRNPSGGFRNPSGGFRNTSGGFRNTSGGFTKTSPRRPF